ncbi:uncharacterized protein LTR77_005132 [Saxophila tyrrhenica]|uniref:SnoaL-like domain-containing protein n=1 Tax=Saxophila tyrrhenica TaxID=1690608 RepID=A0AAV9PBD2_9PEZI|nr:hypothetical protein LTR77_005132 [Saxophila tyrrhenica]
MFLMDMADRREFATERTRGDRTEIAETTDFVLTTSPLSSPLPPNDMDVLMRPDTKEVYLWPRANTDKMPNAGGLTDREAAIDAVIRFVCALDEGSHELSASSMTEDMVLDMTPFQKLGWDAKSTHGRTEVVNLLMDRVGTALDTTHSATNIRCTVSGDSAELTSSVLAQHFRKGEGSSPEFQDYYLFGNFYKAEIVREGELWRIKKLSIAPGWTQGNPEVMKVG